jgi:hypothetical protein
MSRVGGGKWSDRSSYSEKDQRDEREKRDLGRRVFRGEESFGGRRRRTRDQRERERDRSMVLIFFWEINLTDVVK